MLGMAYAGHIQYKTFTSIEQFDWQGVPRVFFLPSYNLYILNRRNLSGFQRMMESAGFMLIEFGENNA